MSPRSTTHSSSRSARPGSGRSSPGIRSSERGLTWWLANGRSRMSKVRPPSGRRPGLQTRLHACRNRLAPDRRHECLEGRVGAIFFSHLAFAVSEHARQYRSPRGAMVVRYAALQQDQCGGHWDLFLLVYKEAHCAGHQCWHLVDPAHPAYSQDAAERLADPLLGWCGTGPHRLNRHCRRRWGAHRRARPGCGRGTTCTMDSAWRLPGPVKGRSVRRADHRPRPHRGPPVGREPPACGWTAHSGTCRQPVTSWRLDDIPSR
jgi:hypothetical protein